MAVEGSDRDSGSNCGVKYLTKKYLKKQDLKEFLRVISTNKNTYQLRYFKIQNEEAAE